MSKELSNGELVIKFIETYCFVPEGKRVGQPIKLEEFQKKFILDVYGKGVRRALLSLGRKNGKTTLIACLVLAHVIGPMAVQNSQVVSGAQSEDQAALIYSLICKMLRLNPSLEQLVTIRKVPRQIEGLRKNVVYNPLATKAKTAFGLSPILAILDEIGQVRGEHDEFISSIETSQGAYENSLLIAISTQAATDGDLFSIWLDDAAKGKDPTIITHQYSADDDADIMDEDQWRKANPGLGTIRDVTDIRLAAQRADRGAMPESSFRNLFMNQRVETFDPYVTKNVWDMNNAPAVDGSDTIWYAGLDLSATRDLTAYVRVAWREDEEDGTKHLHCIPRFFLPGENILEKERVDRQPYTKWAKKGYLSLIPGPTVDYTSVADIILKDIHDGLVHKIAFDRWGITHFMNALIDGGGTKHDTNLFFPFGQGFRDMTPALRRLDEVLYSCRLHHGGNPIMEMCAQNAIVQTDPAGNRKLSKATSTRRIDGIVALAMAAYIATDAETEKVSIYDDPAFHQLIA